MTKTQANMVKMWCAQLETAARLGDEQGVAQAREHILALLDEATTEATTASEQG